MEQMQSHSRKGQPLDEVPQHLVLTLKDLDRLRDFNPVFILITSSVMFSLLPFPLIAMLLIFTGITPVSLAMATTICLATVLVIAVMTTRRAAMLRKYSRELPGRILAAGLVDTLARGYETLPDIAKYTANP